MKLTTVYSKTAKGVQSLTQRGKRLPSDLARALNLVDGKATVDELLEKAGESLPSALPQTLADLAHDGYLKVVSIAPLTEFSLTPDASDSMVVSETVNETFFRVLAETEARKNLMKEAAENPQEARKKAAREATALAKEEISQQQIRTKNAAEAEEQSRKEDVRKKIAGTMAQEEAALKARREADIRAHQEKVAKLENELAEVKERARREAKEKIAQEADIQAAECKAKKEVEERTRQEEMERKITEAKALEEAVLKARREIELQALQKKLEKSNAEAEERARQEAQKEAAKEAEQRKIADANAQEEAEQKARKNDESLARRKNAEKELAELEQQIIRESEAEEKAQAEIRKLLRLEARAREEAEHKKNLEEAEDRTRLEAERENQARLEAEEKARIEEKARADEDARLKAEAAASAREEAERRDREKAAEQEKQAAEARAIMEAEKRAQADEEARLKAEAEASAQKEAERRDREKAAEQEKRAAEVRAIVEAEEKARADEEARIKAEAEARAREEAERKERKEREDRAIAEAVERANREAQEKARDEEEARIKAEAEALAKIEAERKAREEATALVIAEAVEQARWKAEENIRVQKEAQEKARAIAEKKAREEVAQEEQERAAIETRTRALAEQRAEEAEKVQQKTLGKPKKFKRPVKWVKTALISLATLILLPLVLLQVSSLNVFIPPIEKLASGRIGEPVSIKSMRASFWPLPHLWLEGVTIGDLRDIKIPTVRIMPELASFFSETKQINTLEVTSFNIDQDALARVVAWVGSGDKTGKIQIRQIALRTATLDVKGMPLPALEADIALTTAGKLEQANIRSADKKIEVTITPENDGFDVNISAHDWQPPLWPNLTFTELHAKAMTTPGGMRIKEIEGSLYNGKAKGNATLKWGNFWSVEGNLNIENVSLADATSALTNNIALSGKLDAKTIYSMQSKDLSTLFDMPRIKASFNVRDGSISNIDLARAIQPRAVETTGGKTLFAGLSGSMALDGKRYQYRQMKLAAGLLNASGEADIMLDQKLSGKINVEMKLPSATVHARLTLSGDLKQPVLRR